MSHARAGGSPVTIASFGPQPMRLAGASGGMLTVCFTVLEVCFIHPLPVLQGCPWDRHAPAWLLEPGWRPVLPGGGHWRRTYDMDI